MEGGLTVIGLLRGVNIGGHHKVGMAELRSLCESLGLAGARTFLQSGNVIFRTRAQNLDRLAQRIADAIEGEFGFRPAVVLRTLPELKQAADRNPFAARSGMEPSKLAVVFLARDPGREAREATLRIPAGPEELRIEGREMYIYFPNGMARPKLSMPLVERTIRTPGTARSWNTVRRLIALADEIDAN